MTPNRLQITDNIELSAISTDKFKSELLTLTINLPLTKENIAYNMLLTSVLKRGTKSYPSLAELNRKLDELYSSSLDIKSSRLGKNLTFTVSADMLDRHYIPDGTDVLCEVLDIIAEVFYTPHLSDRAFPEKIVEQEKKFLIESLDSIVNNTRGYATTKLSELMFRNDPEFPTVDELKNIVSSITNISLTEFYSHIREISPLRIFYVGNTDTKAFTKEILARFSPWKTNKNIPIVLPYAEPLCEYKSVTEKMPVSQGKLAIGFKTGVCISDKNNEQYAAILLNEIFGGSAASKLFINVREKMSLCYYCSSSYDRYTGTMTVSSGIENKNRQIAKAAILSELEDIKRGKISESELDFAKKSLLNGYRQIQDNPYDLQSYYSNREFFGYTENIEQAKSKILEVSISDISRIAEKIICDSVYFVEGTSDTDEEEYCDE